MNILMAAGPFISFPVLILLIVIIILIAKSFVRPSFQTKGIKLIASLSLFTLAWGFLGQILGLISAFDSIEMAGGVSMEILAAGLKISFLGPVFGLVTFLIGRVGIIILNWREKEDTISLSEE